MYNPFKSKSKQTQTTTFQTQQLQTEQAQNTTQFHREEMQQTSSVNMQPTTTQKHGVFDKQNNVYGIKQSEIRNNYSDERLDAFHENLKMNVSYDRKPDWTLSKKADEHDRQAYKAYIQMMSSISHYADLSPTKTSRKTQAAALSKARLSIKDYLAKYKKKFPALDKIVERYDLYFSTFCDGNMEQTTDTHVHINTVTKNKEPKLHKVDYANVHYADRSKDPLFAHEPSLNDVKQGCLGDCYMLAGVSTLIKEHPEKIKECMKDNGDGTVTVRFYQKFSQLDDESKAEYYLNTTDEHIKTLWYQTDSLSSLSDADLMFKFLQAGANMKELNDLKKAKKKDEDNLYNTSIAIQLETGKVPSDSEIIALRHNVGTKRNMLSNILSNTSNAICAEKTMKLATYLSSVPKVQEDVIAYLRESLSEPNPDMNVIRKEAILKIYELMPESHEIPGLEEKEPTVLDTPEFHQLFNEPIPEEIPADTVVPVYVTVTKKVPVTHFDRDIYSEDCLWLQMLEKAYAASGLHLKNPDERFKKIEDEYKAEEAKLDGEELTYGEKVQKLKELKEKKYQQLHSYDAIIGGFSGEFLQTLTGEAKIGTLFRQITPEEIDKQFDDLSNELLDILSLDFAEYPLTTVTEIINSAANILKDKNLNKQEIKKEDGTTETKEFYAKPFCIEDLLETIEHPDAGSELEQILDILCANINVYFTDKSPKLQNLTIVELKTIISNAIKDVAAVSDKLTVMYRSMSGQYTKRALIEYDRIQNALKKKIPISFGTRQFLPEGVKASGLNGESEQGGMVENHAYSLIGTSEKDGKFFVRVRNPWGSGEMGYKTIKNPDGTTSLVPHKISAKTSGIFDMELNHFLNTIEQIEFNSTAPIN